MEKYDHLIAKHTHAAFKELTRELENWRDKTEAFIDKIYEEGHNKETRIKMVNEQNLVWIKMHDDLMVEHAKKCAEIYQKYQPLREFAAVAEEICNKHTEK